MENFFDQMRFEEIHTKTLVMEKKLQLLWESFSDRSQFEEPHTKKTHEEKICNFYCKIFGTEGNLKKHIQTTQETKIATFVEKLFKCKLFPDRRQFEETNTKYT